jgi:hypothetical protein
MSPRSRPRLWTCLVLGSLLPSAPAAADGATTLKFRNNTGQPADDLHVKLSCAATISDAGGFPTHTDGSSDLTLEGKTVAAGDTATIEVKHACNPTPTVQKWWWTRGGKRVGDVKKGERDKAGVLVAAPACAGGLCTTTITTPSGRLSVYLPDDLATGDTLSGTVVAEPAGRDDEERQANGSRLSGYVVAVEDGDSPPGGGIVTTTLGPAPRIRVWDSSGTPIDSVALPNVQPAPPPPPSFEVPPFAQVGDPLVVPGPFDGRTDGSGVLVAGVPVQVLAESPRGVVVRMPRDVVGPTELVVDEGGRTLRGPLRVVAVNLSAPKLNLTRGEGTELKVEVSGLDGLDRPLPLTLSNLSPSVVTLAGGAEQRVEIAPEMVGEGGRYVRTYPLTGLRSGGFSIEAKIRIPIRSACPEKDATRMKCAPGTCRCLEAEDSDEEVEVFDCTCTTAEGVKVTKKLTLAERRSNVSTP